MEILLAQPRGFCAGVTRAIEIVKRALVIHGAPVYVRHEIVHNKTVVEKLKSMGAIFVDDINDVPDNATLIFSAHGVPKAVERAILARPVRLFDATCPLVKKVHREVSRMHAEGKHVIMIGHAGHPEVEGTMGQIDGGITLVRNTEDVEALPISRTSDIAYVSQTTISVTESSEITAALKRRFPGIIEPKKSDVCYATQNRQDAVMKLAEYTDLVLVIGSTSSSNSNRLREISEKKGTVAYLIEDASQLDDTWFNGVKRIGITAGASAPEYLVTGVVNSLKLRFSISAVNVLNGVEENVVFPMPKGLWDSDLQQTRDGESAPCA